jgi:hypothetical protein
MNRGVESVLRFVNVTTSGLLAGSLGFRVGDRNSASPRGESTAAPDGADRYLHAIGPVALATSMTLAIGADRQPFKRTLDVLSALSLAGLVAATILGTRGRNGTADDCAAADYVTDESGTGARNRSVARSVRTALGFSAFVLSVASNVTAAPSR